jgi:hypothetical protein
MMFTATELFKRCDVVEACGTRFIIVEVCPSRPANPYVAIKERGNGAKYKLGHKHRPRKVGTVPENHYLLANSAFRDFDNLGPGAKQMLRDVLRAVVAGDVDAVQQAENLLGMLD